MKRVIIVCPGRGSYTQASMGRLKKMPFPHLSDLDQARVERGDPSLSELDSAASFTQALHGRGEHISPLIFARSLQDFHNLDKKKYRPVAVVGNSMGHYTALHLAGALRLPHAFELVQYMGEQMREKIIGGQVVYPILDDQWRPNPEARQLLQKTLQQAARKGLHLFVSIKLGAHLVLGGDQEACKFAMKKLPPVEPYFPLKLAGHAAFHTPLLKKVSEQAFEKIPSSWFKKPEIPLVDGQGKIWMPKTTQPEELKNYTLGAQVSTPYSFQKALKVALREFAPDHVVLLGPGAQLGGNIGAVLVQAGLHQMKSKTDFKNWQQASPSPFLLCTDPTEKGISTP